MKQKQDEIKELIDNISIIKNSSYEEFLRLKYIVEGMTLSKKVSKENLKLCSN
ncbi:hypothetical protein [Clostridium botulinum]|uniref:hypothetical protein n=1 Tax=Clostridium botulinum TaxID=1491 RepID=UPI0019685426|nr:hypothetical protein [Clostridium botulinum]